MHVIPFYNRSLLDDVDSWFDDLVWDGPLGYSIFPARGRTAVSHDTGRRCPRSWTVTVRLTGYRPEEVKWELGADNATMTVHARHQDNHNTEDFTEVRRTLPVPDTVDRSRLEVDFTREGILVIKAPYKEQPKSDWQHQHGGRGEGFGALDLFSPWRMTPWREWSDLSEEMQQLHNELLQLQQQSFPGTMGSHFEQTEDGSTRLHLDFNMQGYKPEEISVSHQGNNVVVEARQENKSEQGHLLKHFKRMFTLPENVKLDALTSKLMPNGQLRLEAPCDTKQLSKQAITAEGRDIPVKRLQGKL